VAVAGAAATRDSVDEFDEFAEMDAAPQQPDPEVRSGGRLVDCPFCAPHHCHPIVVSTPSIAVSLLLAGPCRPNVGVVYCACVVPHSPRTVSHVVSRGAMSVADSLTLVGNLTCTNPNRYP
jgi:hypothetical protein